MSRESKFTPELFDKIRSLVAQGRSCAEIASNVGCTVDTLKAQCSQQGISLRRRQAALQHGISRRRNEPAPEPVETICVSLSRSVMDELRSHAQAKNLRCAALVSAILEQIVADDLFEAVLDDAAVEDRRAA